MYELSILVRLLLVAIWWLISLGMVSADIIFDDGFIIRIKSIPKMVKEYRRG